MARDEKPQNYSSGGPWEASHSQCQCQGRCHQIGKQPETQWMSKEKVGDATSYFRRSAFAPTSLNWWKMSWFFIWLLLSREWTSLWSTECERSAGELVTSVQRITYKYECQMGGFVHFVVNLSKCQRPDTQGYAGRSCWCSWHTCRARPTQSRWNEPDFRAANWSLLGFLLGILSSANLSSFRWGDLL